MDAPTDNTTAGSPTRGHEVDQDIMEPFHYINQVPGKDVRGKLIDAFQIWLDIPAERIDAIKEVVGMLHNASLLVDDIEDNSKLRRGVPVAHSIYGVASTINTANYVLLPFRTLTQALERTHALGNSRALETFVHEQLNLHRGQGRDILWRDSNRCPTEEEYESMVLDKTGGLFRLAVGLMQAFSQDQRNYTPLLDQLALYFQIRDDLINLSSPEYMKGKSFCEDLTEGKFSFPIIHCVRAKPNDHRLLNILKQRTEDVDVKKHAVVWMKQAGSFVYTRHRLVSLKESIAEGIQLLGGHLGLSRLIEGLDRQLEGLDLAEPSSSGEPASSSIGGSGSSPGFLDSI
ncbi:unnamed protein product [Ectocarpus sp. 6 AP-2014]